MWFVAFDTVRLRNVLRGRLRAIVEETARAAGSATHIVVLDACAAPSGVRVIVRTRLRSQLRRYARRTVSLLALRVGALGVRWRPVFRIRRIEPQQMPTYLDYFARCRASIAGDMQIKNRKNGVKSTVKKAIARLQMIERSNTAALGGDEVAARIRRYVAAHEAPADDRAAFAKLCYVIFAQGLGFDVVENHREALDAAFCQFAPESVARIGEEQVGKLLHEPIIRNRSKIEACIENARRWHTLVTTDKTYLGRIAHIGAGDDALSGWPKLVTQLQEDFCRLGEPTARLLLKRWGFFAALCHPGVRRALTRLGLINAHVDGPALQLFVGTLAEATSKDAYAIEAALAIFAGVGPCRLDPRCSDCLLNETCPAAQSSAVASL